MDFYKTNIPKPFIIRPLDKVPAVNKPWFVNVPVGINTLNGVLSKICLAGDGVPKYTNHSLRATAASRLFEKGVPEKIIAERTGHRSLAGLRVYERTTEDQDKAVSSALAIKDATFMSSTSSNNSTHCQVIQAISHGDSNVEDKKPTLPTFSGTFHGCPFQF